MKTLEEAIAAIKALQNEVIELRTLCSNRTRGPKTDRPMVEADAFRAKFGDLKGKNHKEVAAELGLSYGQVFSARGGYTFKHVKASWTPKVDQVAPEEAAK